MTFSIPCWEPPLGQHALPRLSFRSRGRFVDLRRLAVDILGFGAMTTALVLSACHPAVAHEEPALLSMAQHQQPRCGERADLVEWLGRGYSERSAGEGLTRQGFVLELFVAEESRTWTLLVTRPDGVSCLVAAGSAWAGTLPAARLLDGDGV